MRATTAERATSASTSSDPGVPETDSAGISGSTPAAAYVAPGIPPPLPADAVAPPPDLITWIDFTGRAAQSAGARSEGAKGTSSSPARVGFSLSRTEVTVAQYRACVAAHACSPPEGTTVQLEQCNWGRDAREDHPINCVTWNQGESFARWVGGRIPLEQEWTLAAGGPHQRTWPWGSVPASCALAVMNTSGQYIDLSRLGCGGGGTSPVCSRPRGNTPEGLCDLAGNVWEWVDGPPTAARASAAPDHLADDARPVAESPGGPDRPEPLRWLRGGSWYNVEKYVRPQARLRRRGSAWHRYYGVRVARDLPVTPGPRTSPASQTSPAP